MQREGFETLAIHAGQDPDPATGAVVPPIYQASTYKQDGVGGLRGKELGAAGAAIVLVDGKPAGVITRQDVLTFLSGEPG